MLPECEDDDCNAKVTPVSGNTDLVGVGFMDDPHSIDPMRITSISGAAGRNTAE